METSTNCSNITNRFLCSQDFQTHQYRVISQKCHGNNFFTFRFDRVTWPVHFKSRSGIMIEQRRKRNLFEQLVLTASRRKCRDAKLILVNIAGRDFTGITACALHTVEWKHLNFAIVLCRNFIKVADRLREDGLKILFFLKS